MPEFTVHHNPTIQNSRYITTPQFAQKLAQTLQKRSSTHVISDASFIKSAINSKKAEIPSFLSNYQTYAHKAFYNIDGHNRQ